MSEYDLQRKTNLPSKVALRSAMKSLRPSAEIPNSQLTDLLARRDFMRLQGAMSVATAHMSYSQLMIFAINQPRSWFRGVQRVMRVIRSKACVPAAESVLVCWKPLPPAALEATAGWACVSVNEKLLAMACLPNMLAVAACIGQKGFFAMCKLGSPRAVCCPS